jgi:hypothetical protein
VCKKQSESNYARITLTSSNSNPSNALNCVFKTPSPTPHKAPINSGTAAPSTPSIGLHARNQLDDSNDNQENSTVNKANYKNQTCKKEVTKTGLQPEE